MKLIPEPSEILIDEGEFYFNERIEIVLEGDLDFYVYESAVQLQEEVIRNIGIKLKIIKVYSTENTNQKIVVSKIKGLDSQAYKLEITTESVYIRASSDVGLFYGIQTLRQVIKNYGAKLPCLKIEDSPYFKHRGFYYDIARGKVPTLQTLKELVDKISFYKINELQLYIEHSFAFENQSEVWFESDPISAQEIIELDEYCKKRYVELIPSLSTFGHLYHALKSQSYQHLNELNIEEKEFRWTYRQHHYTLDVSNPYSFKFVQTMIDEYLPLFSSNKVNIGCDETFDLGKGKNKKLAEDIGVSKLYIDFAEKIIGYINKYGKEVMMWSDVIVNYPDEISSIGDDITYLTWNYEENVKEVDIENISKAGIKQYVCPGVAGWNRLMNNMDLASMNIRSMVKMGEKHKAKGVLNTDWGDFGHINLLSNSIPGMAFGAALSWNPQSESNNDEFDEKMSFIEYKDKSLKLVGLLRAISRQAVIDWENVVLWNYEKIYGEAEEYGYKDRAELLKTKTEEEIHKAATFLKDAQHKLLFYHGEVDVNSEINIREFYVSTCGLELLQALMLLIKKYDYKQTVKKEIFNKNELAEKLEIWFLEYAKVWRVRNKESELFRIKDVIKQICYTLRTYK